MSIGDKIVSDTLAIPVSVKKSSLGANRAYDVLASDIMGAGKGGNVLNQNPNFESGGVGWTTALGTPVYTIITDGIQGTGAVQNTNYLPLVLYSSDLIPVNANRSYAVSGFFRQVLGTITGNTITLGLRQLDSSGNFITTSLITQGVAPTTSWTQYRAYFGPGNTTFANTVSHMQLYVLINDPTFTPQVPGLISDVAFQIQALKLEETGFDGNYTANSFNTVSSRTLKTNIQVFEERATDILSQVQIVSFNFKNEKEPKIGFIAEDTPSYLAGPNHNKMDITNAIGLLIKSVQELKADIENLKHG